MTDIQESQFHHTLRMCDCAICGRSVRVNPLKSTDVDVICKGCRCKRCSIPISDKLCHRCGVAHGTPSGVPGLCEKCYGVTNGVTEPVQVKLPASFLSAIA